jgi:hypothetical protein
MLHPVRLRTLLAFSALAVALWVWLFVLSAERLRVPVTTPTRTGRIVGVFNADPIP